MSSSRAFVELEAGASYCKSRSCIVCVGQRKCSTKGNEPYHHFIGSLTRGGVTEVDVIRDVADDVRPSIAATLC